MKHAIRDEIAAQYRCTVPQMDHYLQLVRRKFRIPPPPSVVLAYLRTLQAAELPSAGATALAIRNQYHYPLKGDKSGSLPAVAFSKSRIQRAQNKLERNARLLQGEPSLSHEGNIAPYHSVDHERVSSETLEHCPHGVPKTRVCAICDPARYKELYGVE